MFGVETVVHKINPIMLKIIPMMGNRGMKGQRSSSRKLNRLPRRIRQEPMIRITRREMKPIRRETRRSKNMWNLMSREADLLAVSAEIWR